ncbi:MAG: type II toxin-antitoxin system RelE/ParE family toxin [Candidatus Aminicenantes bacterium]|nr:type II toxin-antitoxin system RelE/ParE family toxin [Candidatus Aminicenantes bacterium]
MNWQIEIKPNAEKQYLKLDQKTRKRIKESLKQLESAENPFRHNNVKALSGELRGDYRLRVGKWRVLFSPEKKSKLLSVYAILPRGDAY